MNWSTLHLKPHVEWVWAVVGGGRDTPLRAAAGEGRWGLTPVCFCCTGFWHGYCRVHTIPIETNADLSNTPPLIDSSPSAGLHLSNITRLWHFPRCQPTSALKKACILKIPREKHICTFLQIALIPSFHQEENQLQSAVIRNRALYNFVLHKFGAIPYVCMYACVYIYKCVCVCVCVRTCAYIF